MAPNAEPVRDRMLEGFVEDSAIASGPSPNKEGPDYYRQAAAGDEKVPAGVAAKEAPFEVDMSKPLVFQVGHLGERYDEWVHQAVVTKQGPRLFKSDYMEMLTNTYWWMIPLIWLPVVAYSEKEALRCGIPAVAVPIYMAGGVAIWTLLEYMLHRFLFHAHTSSYWMNTLHYLLHGCHHKHPQDPYRLVFPPALCVIFATCVVAPFTLFLPYHVICAMFGGGLAGYVCYDVTHFWLHFGVSMKYPVLYRMRRYHLGHHFKHPQSGYGITSDTWDRVWGTYPVAPAKTSKAS